MNPKTLGLIDALTAQHDSKVLTFDKTRARSDDVALAVTIELKEST